MYDSDNEAESEGDGEPGIWSVLGYMWNDVDISCMVILLMHHKDIYQTFYQVLMPGKIILWPDGGGGGVDRRL